MGCCDICVKEFEDLQYSICESCKRETELKPTVEKLTWWVQLIDSTTLHSWMELKNILNQRCAVEACVIGMDWEGALPEVIDIFGWETPMPMESMLYEMQEYLCAGEYLVFAEMVRKDVVDSNSLKYYIITDETYLVADGRKALKKELLKIIAEARSVNVIIELVPAITPLKGSIMLTALDVTAITMGMRSG